MDSSGSEFSGDENNEIVPNADKELVKSVALNLLNGKSKKLYTTAYNVFQKWRKENKSNSFYEDTLLAYFAHLSKKYSPPSLWATYSMLKSTISINENVEIGRYKKLTAFLKEKSLGYQPKQSKVFSRENISKFLNEAPDDLYLCEKVALIFGIFGGLRREEFVNITVGDVKKVEDENVLLVQVPKTKSYVPRSFTVTNQLYHFCWKYMQARPENCPTDRFFLRYSKGTCGQQPIGINKFGSTPRDIAEYLNLPDPQNFTGHSFRRTSATVLLDADADITAMQTHGGFKSENVAFGYIADSMKSKKRNCEQISDRMETSKRPRCIIPDMEPGPEPSTSGIQVTKSDTNENSATSTSTVDANNGDPFHTSSPLIEPKQENGAENYVYHPDIDLYYQNSTEEGPRPNYTFNNCNITINGPSGNIVMHNCTVTPMCTTRNKAVQTEESGC